MNLDKLVESIIKDAQERGEFDNLKGKGKPIDLTAYFETPEDIRMANSVLKNAGMVSAEVQLLQDIAALKEFLPKARDESQKKKIQKLISEKQLQFNVLIERMKRQRRDK